MQAPGRGTERQTPDLNTDPLGFLPDPTGSLGGLFHSFSAQICLEVYYVGQALFWVGGRCRRCAQSSGVGGGGLQPQRAALGSAPCRSDRGGSPNTLSAVPCRPDWGQQPRSALLRAGSRVREQTRTCPCVPQRPPGKGPIAPQRQPGVGDRGRAGPPEKELCLEKAEGKAGWHLSGQGVSPYTDSSGHCLTLDPGQRIGGNGDYSAFLRLSVPPRGSPVHAETQRGAHGPAASRVRRRRSDIWVDRRKRGCSEARKFTGALRAGHGPFCALEQGGVAWEAPSPTSSLHPSTWPCVPAA